MMNRCDKKQFEKLLGVAESDRRIQVAESNQWI
jgi:hypothetical protein